MRQHRPPHALAWHALSREEKQRRLSGLRLRQQSQVELEARRLLLVR